MAVVLGMPLAAHAHGFERTQDDPFAPWAAGLMGLSLLFYLLAWAHARRRRGVAGPLRLPQLVGYLLGTLALAATLFGALDAAAEHSFAAHLSQHMLLLAVVPPLLLLGRPMLASALLLPRAFSTPMGWAGRLRRSLHLHAVLATLASTVAMWLWHAPAAMHQALSDEAVHWLMHLCFLAAGLWFWMVPLEALRGRARVPWPALAGLLALMMQMGLIGALLTLSSRPLVPLQAERALAAGLDPITDQQLAGLLMWVPFCLPYLAAAVMLGLRTARLQRRRRPCMRELHDSADIDS